MDSLLIVLLVGLDLVAAGHAGAGLEFERRTLPGGGQPFAIVAADLDHDGTVDLAVTNPKVARFSVYHGKGDGTFDAPRHIETGKQPRGIAVADFDGDGLVDVAIAATRQNIVAVHPGSGDGAFGNMRTYAVGRRPFMLATVDIDRDGHPDIVVTNEDETAEEHSLSILRGDGRGGFSGKSVSSGRFAADVAAADFNSDGHTDLAVGAWGSNDVTMHFGRGDGTFGSTARFTYAGGHGIYRVLAIDLDRDGNTDMVWNDLRRSGLYVLYGDGAGGFPRTSLVPAGPGVRHAAVADLDRNGWLDLVSANTGAGTISVILADGRGGFLPGTSIEVGTFPRMIAATDLDADGLPDIVVTNMQSNDLHVLLNRGPAPPTTRRRQPVP